MYCGVTHSAQPLDVKPMFNGISKMVMSVRAARIAALLTFIWSSESSFLDCKIHCGSCLYSLRVFRLRFTYCLCVLIAMLGKINSRVRPDSFAIGLYPPLCSLRVSSVASSLGTFSHIGVGFAILFGGLSAFLGVESSIIPCSDSSFFTMGFAILLLVSFTVECHKISYHKIFTGGSNELANCIN